MKKPNPADPLYGSKTLEFQAAAYEARSPTDREHRKESKMNDTPRRIRLDMMTPAELAIRHALLLVEALGAAPTLTDAVSHLQSAREHVADYVDGHVK